MAFDAVMLRLVVNEIKGFGELKIEKVYQPSNDEIVLMLHTPQKNFRLLINAGSNCPRINITGAQSENPQKAPMLCMLLRKHINGGKIVDIRCPSFERVCELEIEAYDEMGYKVKKYLICEIMGKFSNIILTDSNKKILALLKSVDFTTSEKRQLLVGMTYEMPPKQDKICTIDATSEEVVFELQKAPDELRLDKFLLSRFSGIATSTARQLAYLASGSSEELLCNVKKQTLVDTFCNFVQKIRDFDLKPIVIYNENDELFEFSYLPLEYLGKGYKNVECESFSQLIDLYFNKKSQQEKMRQKSQDIFRILTNAETRITKKILLQQQELAECEDAEQYRIMGDLLTANLHMVKKGATVARVINYYDDECPMIEIPLDEKLSPSQNAQRFYKKYNKLKKAKIELTKQIEIAKKELEYIHSVLDSLSRAEKESDLNQIREELFHSGYASKMKNYSSVKQGPPQPLKFTTSGGYTVLCGKNNTQNDYITTKIAEKSDWWFHVKSLPGSHVLLQVHGAEPSEKDFTEAAEIAAYYSKAEGNNIAVDYTYAKHVKKPAGSKPGYVIYHINWTAYVTPSEKRINEMLNK